MAGLTLSSEQNTDITIISNYFIDNVMCDANGEFVKIYVYLLRCTQKQPEDFSLLTIADKMNLTEKDVFRALKYWAQKGFLSLTADQNGLVTSILLKEPIRQQTKSSVVPRHIEDSATIRELGLIAEQYLKRTLNSDELDKIVYFYNDLRFSPDLIEYLFEHCATIGNNSMRYVESVAISWADKGFTTVKQAKEEGQHYRREYFTIIKAFGIRNRNPIDNEVQYMKKWLDEYHFTTEVICEACQRTIAKTGNPVFAYADSILKNWKEHGIFAKRDIEALDRVHHAQKAAKHAAVQTSQKPVRQAASRFNNFEQRDEYDFNQLEKQLNLT